LKWDNAQEKAYSLAILGPHWPTISSKPARPWPTGALTIQFDE